MQRKLAELIVDVEAAQALVFDGFDPAHRLRIGAPLIKLRASRLGITAASDAIEVHGGNGYVENWPVARILRDAQVNPLWEGPDNILCLDVRRGIEREQADVAFLHRLREALDARAAGRPDDVAGRRARGPARRRDRALEGARPRRSPSCGCSRSPSSWSTSTPARCSSNKPAYEQRELGSDRKALVARLYARRHLADHGPLRGIDEPRSEELDRFKDLWDGAALSTTAFDASCAHGGRDPVVGPMSVRRGPYRGDGEPKLAPPPPQKIAAHSGLDRGGAGRSRDTSTATIVTR